MTQWTPEQERIFHEVDVGRQNVVVTARAGTGKTTTILEALNHASEREVLLCAFNKAIADELRRRVQNPAVQVKTLHALGLRCIMWHWPSVTICDGNERRDALMEKVYGKTLPDGLKYLVGALHSKARELTPHAEQIEEIEQLAANFDLLPDPEWENKGWPTERLAKGVLNILEAAKEPTDSIDFSDMIFLPLVHDWASPCASLVMVDEAQDMSQSQLELAQRSVYDSGRIILVGDDRQAIYGFRGADSDALGRLTQELDAKELGLKTTFRCPQSVVKEAQRYVPDFYAHPNNPEGNVRFEMQERLVSPQIEPGAFVLSRTNAPLLEVALDLIRAGIPATVRGRDIAKGLLKIVKKHYDADLDQFLTNLHEWFELESKRARKLVAGGAQRLQVVQDQIAAIQAVADRVKTTAEIQTKIDQLFSDAAAWKQVICSTVHRAKGLEANQVWVLLDTFRAKGKEEDNVRYVAITRAKDQLIYVGGGHQGVHEGRSYRSGPPLDAADGDDDDRERDDWDE